MRNIYFFIVMVALIVKCNTHEQFDCVEYLKQCLTNYGFHPDTRFNTYREYSWKIKQNNEDSLLLREAAFYLLDGAAYHTNADNTLKRGLFLLIQEYQYFPNRKDEYVLTDFPSVYEEEKKKNLCLEHFYNHSKGLRHDNTPDFIEFQQKVVLSNRFVQMIISMKRGNVTDTTNARNLLKIFENGLIQSNRKKAHKKYLKIKESPLWQSNLILERRIKNSATAAETNYPPMEEEAKEIKRLESTFYNNDISCCSVDICPSEDGCIEGGYISITVQSVSGLPVDSAACSLLAPNKYRYNNKTNKFGSARWCRVKKDRYTIELLFNGKKYTFSPMWDSLPRMDLIRLK